VFIHSPVGGHLIVFVFIAIINDITIKFACLLGTCTGVPLEYIPKRITQPQAMNVSLLDGANFLFSECKRLTLLTLYRGSHCSTSLTTLYHHGSPPLAVLYG
jgi:hypothetical protein